MRPVMGRGRDGRGERWEDNPEYPYDEGYEERDDYPEGYERVPVPRRRTRRASGYPPPEHQRARPVRTRRRRSAMPALLGGCILGVLLSGVVAAIVVFFVVRSAQGITSAGVPGLGNTSTFTRDDSIPVTLSSPPLAQLQICNNIGNITLHVDPQASQATVATHKIVRTSSQQSANQEFGRITVETQPPGSIKQPLSCGSSSQAASSQGNAGSTMIVNATVPESHDFLHSSNDAVDLTITLPQKALPPDPSLAVTIVTAVGNISTDGLSGVLTIKGSSGNIEIKNSILGASSHLETGQGNVTFNGFLANAGSGQSQYKLQTEQGNIDVTLPGNTNLTLDANTNVGKVTSEFGTNIQGGSGSGGGQVNYHGPLSSGGSASTNEELILDVSTGNIAIHKAS